MASEWRAGKPHWKGMTQLVDVREGGPIGSRFVCEATPEDAAAIVADHAAAEREAALRAENERLKEMASGMAACVQALDDNGAWFSRSRIAYTLRDSLRTWASEFVGLTGDGVSGG